MPPSPQLLLPATKRLLSLERVYTDEVDQDSLSMRGGAPNHDRSANDVAAEIKAVASPMMTKRSKPL